MPRRSRQMRSSKARARRRRLSPRLGFRDVLEMRRLRIPELYNLRYDKPDPLVPRRRRYEVRERIGPRGDLRAALDESSVHAVAAALARERRRGCSDLPLARLRQSRSRAARG